MKTTNISNKDNAASAFLSASILAVVLFAAGANVNIASAEISATAAPKASATAITKLAPIVVTATRVK